MLRSLRFPTLLVIPLVLASFAVAGCSRDAGGRKANAPLATDTMLARDIARASGDTSGFTEAADIAQGAATDTLPFSADSAQAATSPAMRVPARTAQSNPAAARRPAPESNASSASESAPAHASPAAATPAPSAPAPASSRAYGGNIPLDASCNSPTLPSQRRCLLLYLAKSDETLDRNYQALISDLKADAGTRPGEKEPPRVTRLRVAQRAWLVYRDNECRRRNRGLEGPLWAPMRARCLAEYSAKRSDELASARNR